MKKLKKMVSFRLSEATIERIKEISETMELSQVVIVEQAVKEYYDKNVKRG